MICRLCKITVLRESRKGDLCSACEEKIQKEEYQKSDTENTRNSPAQIPIESVVMQGEMLTIKQVANKMHYTERTIINWIHQGIIRAFRLPKTRKYLISWEECKRAGDLMPGNQNIPSAGIVEGTLGYYYAKLSAAMEILRSAHKSNQDIEKAVALFEELPFREDTARHYADFLAPTSHLLTADEKSEVLEGFRIIYDLNRSRVDPPGVHLCQRSAHWMARSGEQDFTMMVKRLYRKTDIALIKRGMMIGLILAELMEPEEFLEAFLNTETHWRLDMLVYQMRSKDIPYDLNRLLDKNIELGQSFAGSLQTLFDELRENRGKPYGVLSLRTLNNMLAYGDEIVLSDLKSVLSLPAYRTVFSEILEQSGVSGSCKAEVEKFKKFIRGHSALLKSLQAGPGGGTRL